MTQNEIENVSLKVETRVTDLVEEMEMEYSCEKAKESSQGLAHAVISDFAIKEDGKRYKLAQFLEASKFHCKFHIHFMHNNLCIQSNHRFTVFLLANCSLQLPVDHYREQ